MRVRAAVIPACASLLVRLSSPAFAQPAPGASTSVQADPSALARARFTDGVAFATKQEWQRAYAAFAEAWSLKNHPQIALNLGRSEIETGRFRDAALHLRYCVSHMEASDPDLKLAREWLAEAEKSIARLVITVDVPGADVLVDGASEGRSPLPGPVLVDPGTHRVEVRRGAASAIRTLDVAPGASAEVSLDVFLDVTPPTAEAPPAATAASRAPLSPAPGPPAGGSLRTAGLATGGVLTAAGLAIGGAFLGIAAGKDAEIQDAKKDFEGRAAGHAAARAKADALSASIWGFMGAGVAAAGTVAFHFVTRPSQQAPPVKGAIGVTPAGPAILVEGQF